MPPNQPRAAVVGCGGAGANHAAGYRRAAGAELVAVCDIDEACGRLADVAFDAVDFGMRQGRAHVEPSECAGAVETGRRRLERGWTAAGVGPVATCGETLHWADHVDSLSDRDRTWLTGRAFREHVGTD